MFCADQQRLHSPDRKRTFVRGPIWAIALCLAVSLAAIAPPVIAQGSGAVDPRLVTITFDEGRVFTINGKVKVQTTVKFAPDETIQNVAIGDSTAWQVQPNQAQTILFVKPLATDARTNMTVVTSRRTYLFDLISAPRNAPLYVLQFRYPELEAAAAEALLAKAEAEKNQREQASAVELAAAKDPFAVVDPAALNFSWESAGMAELLPERAYDDGDAVFLTWGKDASVPAILVTNDEGEEGPVNFTVRGDTVVLDMVPAQIILRSGGETATLTNTGPAPVRSANTQTNGSRGS